VWAVIHAEWKALAAILDTLTPDQWATPSLCGGWTVRDVLAHMTAAAKLTPPQFFVKLLTSGFSFEAVQAKGIAAERGSSPAETLARFTAEVNSTKHPPGPTDTWLGEAIVHAEDIRRPLHIQHAYPADAVVQVANFYKQSNLIIGAKNRIASLTLPATDQDALLDAGGGPFGPHERPMAGYVTLPPALAEDDARPWIARSLDYIGGLPQKKAKKASR
jgi:uncharacterized protein (TIGR03083 family)